MRGSVLFQDLFTDQMTEVKRERASKGRCSELDAKRNELLLTRYYYYGKYSTHRWEVILHNLETEFFLSQRRIIDIIQSHAPRLRELRSDFPPVQELRKKYPHLSW